MLEPEYLTSEEQLMRACSECYILLQKYKLRTNLVGVNLEKELVETSYTYLEERITDRYTKIFQKLKEGVAKLEVNFKLAQGNSLRTLNNIFRNYRRRVGTLTNEPLSSLKYARYDRQEKVLLESIVYSQRENLQQISSFKEQLQRNLASAIREIQEKYRHSDKIKEHYSTIFEIIDKTQCYTYKHYEGFQRSMLTTVASLQAHFDKLNGFLSVWENVGSTKAYEAKSIKELESQEKSHQNDRNRRYYEEQTEEQLQQLMKNCPQHSPQRQQYRKRLNELRRYNSQKQKKLDMVGKMYSKRRNRAGILVNRSKQVSVLEWVINLDNTKVPYSHHDEFKNYRADNDHTDYRLTPYQSQRPMKTPEQAREHLEKHRPAPLNYQWWYDRFGSEGTLDLISCQSQQLQKRIQFEVVRQTQLQNSDDRRKRELLEKQAYQMKENERRECLHIGYRHVHDKTQLQWLMERTYNTQYIPNLIENHEDDDISFSDDDKSDRAYEEPKKISPITTGIAKNIKKQEKEIEFSKEEIPLVKMVDEPIISKNAPLPSSNKNQQPPIPVQPQINQGDLPLEQQIIKTYFKQYSKKIIRKQAEPQYKKTEFLYFKDPSDINWSLLQSYIDCEKIFIYTHKSILFFNKIFSVKQQKMKCSVYTVQEDEDATEEEEKQAIIKKAVQGCFKNYSLVTVRFHPIYLENEDLTCFMMGLLMILMRQGQMFQDSEIKHYVNEGKEIIQDFSQYYFPKDNKSTKSLFMRKFMPYASQQVFAPVKKPQKDEKALQNELIKSSIPSTIPQSFKLTQKPLQKQKRESIQNQPNPKAKEQVPPPKPIPEQSSSFDNYSKMQEQRELKRSNSREYLNSYDLQLQMSNRQYEPQGDDSGQSQGDDQIQF